MCLNFIVPSAIRNAADFNPEYKVLIVLLLSVLHSEKKKINAAKNTVFIKIIGAERYDVINVEYYIGI
jgi:hypothetical protein